MKLLEGKTAIITGASSGIGAAAARMFALHGAKLVINARNTGPLEQVAEELPQKEAPFPLWQAMCGTMRCTAD